MKKLYILFLASLMVLGNSCSEYLDINEDPSFPQVAAGYAILPPIFQQMVRGESFDSRYTGRYVQYWGWVSAGDTYDRHGYTAGSDAHGEHWRQHYWAIGTNIDLIINEGLENNRYDYIGAAKAIRAWSLQSTTDMHGPMILSQAFEPNRYVFDYDSQEDCYKEVSRIALEAVQDLSQTGYAKSLNRGDLVYKGDTDKWTRFAYGVLARNAHHISNKATYNPDKVIEYVDKSFRSNADNFNVPHAGTSSSDGNFYGPLRNNLGSYRQSAYIISLLDGTVLGAEDPRLPIMFTASPDGVYRGVLPGGGDPNNVTGNVKRIPNLWGALGVVPTTGRWIFNNAADHSIMTYMELQFVKAEAAFIKGDKAMAHQAYLNGVGAALDYCGVTAANKAGYLASASVAQSAADLKLSDIMLQKYIALYVHGSAETWVDMRRYNYSPDVYTSFSLPTSLYPDNNGLPAQRVRPRYNSEYVWNRAALAAIGADLPDYHTKVLWNIEK